MTMKYNHLQFARYSAGGGNPTAERVIAELYQY